MELLLLLLYKSKLKTSLEFLLSHYFCNFIYSCSIEKVEIYIVIPPKATGAQITITK